MCVCVCVCVCKLCSGMKTEEEACKCARTRGGERESDTNFFNPRAGTRSRCTRG